MSRRSIPLQPIGNTSVFCRLVQSPVACLKKSKISFRAAMSYFLGLTKVTVSSAYRDALIPLNLGEIG
jgi:hypothetical protein